MKYLYVQFVICQEKASYFDFSSNHSVHLFVPDAVPGYWIAKNIKSALGCFLNTNVYAVIT